MPAAFGPELLRRRKLQRLSRSRLARLSGVSESQIGNLERQGAEPGRTTVIDLASAFPDWDVDKALKLAGHAPLTEDERAAEKRRRDKTSREVILQLLAEASDHQLRAVEHVLWVMIHHDTPWSGGCGLANDWTVIPLGTEILSRGEPAPQEPPYGDNGAEDPDNGAGATPNGAPQNGT